MVSAYSAPCAELHDEGMGGTSGLKDWMANLCFSYSIGGLSSIFKYMALALSF